MESSSPQEPRDTASAMSKENVEIVSEAFESFLGGDR